MPLTINCDMGESFGLYGFGDDAACMPFVTHANIACGFHASDPKTMWRTVKQAAEAGIGIGAHPGLPDREGFGRRAMKMSREDVVAMVHYQCGALNAFLAAEGLGMSHIKPHGALFGMAQSEEHVAEAIADVALSMELPVIGYSNCEMSRVFTRRNVPFVCEFYADLDYGDDGRQIISMSHKAFDGAEVVQKVERAVAHGTAKSVNGREIEVVADTICVHSDTPGALDVARAVHAALADRLSPSLVQGRACGDS